MVKARCVRCHTEFSKDEVFDKLINTAFSECPNCGFTGYGENWWFEWVDESGKTYKKPKADF